jgi:gliding motility-associated-like protein
VCQNAAAPTITFTGANTTAPYTFTYSLNGVTQPSITSVGNTAIVTQPTAASGPYTYSLISVQDASSVTCAQAQSGSALVTVNQLPTATITGNIVVCQGDPSPVITFTGATTTPAYTFTYNINGGANQVITTPAGSSTMTVSVPTGIGNTYSYNLINVKDGSSAACSNAVNGQANVVVNKLPVGSIAESQMVVCQNDPPPVITFTGGNGTTPYTFIYTVNGAENQVGSTNGSQGMVTVPTTQAMTYTYQLDSVEYTSGNKTCISKIINQSASVVVKPLPTATIAGGEQVCVGSKSPVVTFTGQSGTAPYSFVFNVNNGNSSTIQSIGTNSTVTFPVSTDNMGTYTYSLVGVTDSNTCYQAQNGSTTVVINENPIAIFTITPENPTILEPTVSITNNSSATAFVWDFGDSTKSVAQNPGSHMYKGVSATYIVKLVTSTGLCKDSTYQTVVVQAPLLLYIPNTFTPNGDGLNDVFMPKGEGIISYSMYMYDRWGNMIFYSDDINKGWDGRANGGNNIAQEDAYVYIINVTDPQGHNATYRGIITLVK